MDVAAWCLELLVAVGTFLLVVQLHLVLERWRRLKRIEAVLRRQGLKGPPPASILAGNSMQQVKMRERERTRETPAGVSHDIMAWLTPEAVEWSKLYGKPYMSRWLRKPRVTFFDPEAAREVLSKQYRCFGKLEEQLVFILDYIGYGLLGVSGEEWSRHRTILSPAFFSQKLKGMVGYFEQCSEELVESWRRRVAEGGGETEVEVSEEMRKLSADGISRTAFGINYKKGERVFEQLKLLAESVLTVHRYSWIPLFRYIPVRINFRVRKLRREMDELIQRLISERRELVQSGKQATHGDDMLGLLLDESTSANKISRVFNDKNLVDECKTFFYAGHETTGALMGWTLLLLATNPLWQERARDEALEHCRDGFQSGEALGKLKLLGMILNETLRLYPVLVELEREVKTETVVNGLRLPKGTGVILSVVGLHHDKEIWGADVHEFKPERFSEGCAKACKHPSAFLPFSSGPRICIGQSFALMEAKIALAKILMSFSFTLAPCYKHHPVLSTTIVASYGIQLNVKFLKP